MILTDVVARVPNDQSADIFKPATSLHQISSGLTGLAFRYPAPGANRRHRHGDDKHLAGWDIREASASNPKPVSRYICSYHSICAQLEDGFSHLQRTLRGYRLLCCNHSIRNQVHEAS